MPEYIERESLINHVEDLPTWGTDGDMLDRQDVIGSIENRPAADVAPVRHGRWLPTTKWWQGGSAWKQCSECGILHCGKSLYCPNCWCKMDLEG